VSRRALVIEDHADARHIMRVLLSRLGHQVFEAADGHGGVAAAAVVRPEIVFIDVGLPDLDGYQVAAALRAILGASAQLVALTGYRRPDDPSSTACFDAYVVKPVEPDLIARLCSAC
jgi:CheY-like chemotaxis protein